MRKKISLGLAKALEEALGDTVAASVIEDSFEIPRHKEYGDLATPIVFKLAKEKKMNPRAAAEKVCASLKEALKKSELGKSINKIQVEGPGFINFFFSNAALADVLKKIKNEGAAFGAPKLAHKKKILLEFVSANPTGPLTVAHGRQAALGDSLARILTFCGHRVEKEYYNNDVGVQITVLGQSIRSRYLTLSGAENSFPEVGYKGDYITEIAKELYDKDGDKHVKKSDDFFSILGKEFLMQGIKKDLESFRVEFDHYFSQEELMAKKEPERVLETLKKKGYVYEKEGAVWFRSTEWGDDKDRVLIKSDKNYTYLLPDIAYHENKFKRKFDLLINILGPDHHGYIPRLKAAACALGFSKDNLAILIAQLVTLFEGEKELRMSTRAGEFVTLRAIIDEVGVDAGRFFFLMRKFDAHLSFDLSLAKSQTPDNPVFYIQYAHARVESIKKKFSQECVKKAKEETDLSCLNTEPEMNLMGLLSQFEEAVLGAEKTLEPYRLVPYLMEVAGAFHRFYTEHRVIVEDANLTQARFELCLGVQQVLRTGLELLGVSAPLKM